MILKLMGCILIIASSTLMGYSAAYRYVRRPQELRALQSALQILESEIIFSVNPLTEAFDRISKNTPQSIGIIFKSTANLLKQKTGMTAQQAWALSLKNCESQMNLNKEDIEILLAFGSSLGCSDRDNQVKNIHLACSKLAIEEKKAEILKEKNEKLYKNLGILGGMLISLLLI